LAPLFRGGGPRWNQSYVLASVGVHDHDDPPDGVQSQRHEPALIVARLVLKADRIRIHEHSLCVGKTDAVLLEVRLGPLRVPGRTHVCMICISRPGVNPHHALYDASVWCVARLVLASFSDP
jgi:hypothetical protein